jgi:hypothetical protein
MRPPSRRVAPRLQGELVDGGGDVGKAESAQDVLYLVAIAHLATVVTPWGWALLLAVPATAGLWLWRNVVSPYIFSGGDAAEGAGKAGGRRGARAERRGGKGAPRR